MIRSVNSRVVLLISSVLLLLVVIYALIAFMSHRAYAIELGYTRAQAFAERILDSHPWLWERYEGAPSAFSDQLRQFILLEPQTGLYLLDDEGKVLASAGEGRLFWSNYRVDLSVVREWKERDPRNAIIGDDPDVQGEQCVVAARPIEVGGVTKGWLYVVARAAGDTGAPGSTVWRYSTHAVVKIAIVTLAVGLLLSLAVLTMFTRPLSKLTVVTDRIRCGGFAEKPCDTTFPHAERPDEIGALSRTFRATFDRLAEETERVKKTDAVRREMVANVSHDLRTPLTALIGQLDTISMKGANLSAVDRDRFFDGARKNAEHLRRLTDALAELSKLDAPEVAAQLEPAAVGDLLDDIAQRYRARAEEAGVAFTVSYADRLPLSDIDVDLLERAIGNLVDNALRATPAGGRIDLRAHSRDGRIELEVADTGPGVPEKDQSRVFDRFFQVDEHRHLRGSSGLGLAIVKRVVELHRGQVGVRNSPHGGAVFWMTLPARGASTA